MTNPQPFDYDKDILEKIRKVLEEYDNGNLESEDAVMKIYTIGEM